MRSNSYFLLHLLSSRTAYRVTGYMSEQTVHGYTRYLDELTSDVQPDIDAPAFAVDYWQLSSDAKIGEMLLAMCTDEAIHRDIHHAFADALFAGKLLPDMPAIERHLGGDIGLDEKQSDVA